MSSLKGLIGSEGLPVRGFSRDVITEKLMSLKVDDLDWRDGRLPNYTFFFEQDVLDLQMEAYNAFMIENGLGVGRAFKSLGYMLEDIYTMSRPLFGASDTAGVSFTSGGTESVFMAVKTARSRARAKSRYAGAQRLNVVTGISAHPCLDKAADILDLDVRRVPLCHEFRMDVQQVRKAIDDATIMVYASAPSFPYGVFDPIAELGQLSLEKDLWLHVDACWGGFLSPFAKKLGYDIPNWDLSVPGVTSLSADIHKYGYAAKGASLVFYSDRNLQAHERFEFSDWPRGTYTTPTFTGTKPGGSIAAAWAVMCYLGEEGYTEAARRTMDTTVKLINEIDSMPELQCLTPNKESSLFAYVSLDEDVDIMALANRLEETGWFRGRLREPLAIHQGVNPSHQSSADRYIAAVKASIDHVRRHGEKSHYDEDTY